jgi:hypothetical protein
VRFTETLILSLYQKMEEEGKHSWQFTMCLNQWTNSIKDAGHWVYPDVPCSCLPKHTVLCLSIRRDIQREILTSEFSPWIFPTVTRAENIMFH